MMKWPALVSILIAGPGIPSVAAADCPHKAPREAVVDASGARSVRVEAGSGSLRVEGRDGQAAVEARGTACASDAAVLEQIQLRVRRQGDVIVVKAEIPERESSWSWNERAGLDLIVTLPRGLAVEVADGSGDTAVAHVGALRIEDGSGSIDVRNVGGSVTIDRDGSGSIDVSEVKGDFTVTHDGSGGIDHRQVAGQIRIPDRRRR